MTLKKISICFFAFIFEQLFKTNEYWSKSHIWSQMGNYVYREFTLTFEKLWFTLTFKKLWFDPDLWKLWFKVTALFYGLKFQVQLDPERERERKYALKLKRKNFTCRVSFLPWPVSPENWFRDTSSYRRHCIDRVWVQISQKEYNCASYK